MMPQRTNDVLGKLLLVVTMLLAACGPSGVAGTTQSTTVDGTGTTASGSSDSTMPSTDALASDADAACEAGAREGEALFGSGMDPDVFTEMIEPFNEKNPDITMRFHSEGSSGTVQRLLAQHQAGRPMTQDAYAGNLGLLIPLIQAGGVAAVDWRAYDVAENLITEIEGIEFVRNYRISGGLVYNTNESTEDDLPDTWEELVDPSYAGQFTIDPRGVYLAPLALAWGEEQAIDWYSRLLEVAQPVVQEGSSAAMQQVQSGQYLFTTNTFDDSVEQAVRDGAPVALKYLDVVTTVDQHAFIIEGAPNPNAVLCFVSWFVSEEGQSRQFEYESKNNLDQPENLPADASLVSIASAEDADLVARVSKEMANLTTGQ